MSARHLSSRRSRVLLLPAVDNVKNHAECSLASGGKTFNGHNLARENVEDLGVEDICQGRLDAHAIS